MRVTKGSIYRFLLITLIVFQVFGLYGLMGGILSPARIMAIAVLVPIFSDRLFAKFLINEKFLMFFVVFTLGYAFTLLLFYQSDKSINYLIYATLNLLLLFEIVFLSGFLKNAYFTLWKAVLIFISLSIPIAFVELVYDVHLSVSYLDSNQHRGSLSTQKFFASVTFGNYNLYNFLLVISTPILSSFFLSNSDKSRLIKWYTSVVLIAIFVILVMNGSRAASIGYVISMVFFVWFYFKINRFNKLFFLKVLILMVPLFILGLYYFINSNISTYLLYRFTNSGFEDNVRSTLITSGLTMLTDSYFLGVGPANYEVQLAKLGTSKYILPPHNMFIEVAAELGIFVFAAFIFFLFKIFRNIGYVPLHIKYILIVSLITMPLNFVINSNYVYNIYMWIYFAVLYVLSKARKIDY